MLTAAVDAAAAAAAGGGAGGGTVGAASAADVFLKQEGNFIRELFPWKPYFMYF